MRLKRLIFRNKSIKEVIEGGRALLHSLQLLQQRSVPATMRFIPRARLSFILPKLGDALSQRSDFACDSLQPSVMDDRAAGAHAAPSHGSASGRGRLSAGAL